MEQCRSSGCIWNPSFGGGVIAKATKANNWEALETVDCSIPNCKTCTDIFNDAIIDLQLRDMFLRNSRNLKAIHHKQLGEDQLLLLPYRICGFLVTSSQMVPSQCFSAPRSVGTSRPFRKPSPSQRAQGHAFGLNRGPGPECAAI